MAATNVFDRRRHRNAYGDRFVQIHPLCLQRFQPVERKGSGHHAFAHARIESRNQAVCILKPEGGERRRLHLPKPDDDFGLDSKCAAVSQKDPGHVRT
jgi:hypothetical protein